MEALLNQYPEMDAVFVSNDQMALGAMRTAQKRGRRIPQTLGMVGYDDIPESGFYMPSLTTVHQNLSMLGNMAVQELERLIEAGRKSEMDIQYRSILLKPELVIRESSRMFGENQKGGEAGQ